MTFTIQLANLGVFPLGKVSPVIAEDNDTGFNFPGTIQGEGRLTGTPSLFVRMSGCNLRCKWCDTSYTSWQPEKNHQNIDEVVQSLVIAAGRNIKHIVISGGEPFVQVAQLRELVDKLKRKNFHLTIETNGTIFDEFVAWNTDLMSISPKLANSTPPGVYKYQHETNRINLVALKKFVLQCRDYQFKFVVADRNDLTEIDALVKQFEIKPEAVYLMPEGQTQREINEKLWVCGEAIRRGYRYSPRLHILLWGNRRGV